MPGECLMSAPAARTARGSRRVPGGSTYPSRIAFAPVRATEETKAFGAMSQWFSSKYVGSMATPSISDTGGCIVATG